MAPRLRVTLDIGPAVHQRAGLSRYAERLATYLLVGQSHRLDVTLFYNRHSGHSPPDALPDAPVATLRLGQRAWRLSALASQMFRLPYPPLARNRSVGSPWGDVYHATEHLLPNVRSPAVLTVHDLIFERYPEHHTRANRLFLKMAMPLFLRAADAVIAVSRQSMADIVEFYRITAAEKFHIIYEGVDPVFQPVTCIEAARVRDQYSAGRPYLLMVGTLEPRKNHATALRALARLKAAGYPQHLVITGGEGWLFAPVRRLVDELGLAGEVHFAGYVPLADLTALYSGADCVLVPSLYEGFGFPVLEAMACGTPVVCSNASSLPEVAGDAALLVAPTDVDACAAAVRRILEDASLAASLRERGLKQAARFRWENCAAQTADLYFAVAAQATAQRQRVR
jgi:glycosyltransferase involved in cell wall biosynthesis